MDTDTLSQADMYMTSIHAITKSYELSKINTTLQTMSSNIQKRIEKQLQILIYGSYFSST